MIIHIPALSSQDLLSGLGGRHSSSEEALTPAMENLGEMNIWEGWAGAQSLWSGPCWSRRLARCCRTSHSDVPVARVSLGRCVGARRGRGAGLCIGIRIACGHLVSFKCRRLARGGARLGCPWSVSKSCSCAGLSGHAAGARTFSMC